jgi:hypothetical protein
VIYPPESRALEPSSQEPRKKASSYKHKQEHRYKAEQIRKPRRHKNAQQAGSVRVRIRCHNQPGHGERNRNYYSDDSFCCA